MKMKIEEILKTSRDGWVQVLRNALAINYQFYYIRHQGSLTGLTGVNHPDVRYFASPRRVSHTERGLQPRGDGAIMTHDDEKIVPHVMFLGNK